MEVLEIKTSRKEYERLMKTMKKLGLNPSINYTITEKEESICKDLSTRLSLTIILFSVKEEHIQQEKKKFKDWF
jgi:hypothetical protein